MDFPTRDSFSSAHPRLHSCSCPIPNLALDESRTLLLRLAKLHRPPFAWQRYFFKNTPTDFSPLSSSLPAAPDDDTRTRGAANGRVSQCRQGIHPPTSSSKPRHPASKRTETIHLPRAHDSGSGPARLPSCNNLRPTQDEWLKHPAAESCMMPREVRYGKGVEGDGPVESVG